MLMKVIQIPHRLLLESGLNKVKDSKLFKQQQSHLLVYSKINLFKF